MGSMAALLTWQNPLMEYDKAGMRTAIVDHFVEVRRGSWAAGRRSGVRGAVGFGRGSVGRDRKR